jgi:thiol-disulfide isomerase/thioredoxin
LAVPMVGLAHRSGSSRPADVDQSTITCCDFDVIEACPPTVSTARRPAASKFRARAMTGAVCACGLCAPPHRTSPSIPLVVALCCATIGFPRPTGVQFVHRRLLVAIITVWTVSGLPLSGPASAAQAPPATGEQFVTRPSDAASVLMQAFGKAGPGEHYRITFLDAHGKKLDFATFMREARDGRHFVIDSNAASHTATWKLFAPGSAPKDSMFIKPPPPTLKAGATFPAFRLPLSAGGFVDNAAFRHQPYLVDFFFADCTGCVQELPQLDAYAKRHPAQRVLAVTFDDKATTSAFIRKWHPAWPVAYAGLKLTDKAGIDVYPTLALIGADGKLLALHVGEFEDAAATGRELDGWVKAHLASNTPQSRTPH